MEHSALRLPAFGRCAACALCMGLSACSTADTWYKAGAAVASQDRDLTQCQVRAAQDVPPNVVARGGTPYYTPGFRRCYTAGGHTHCHGTRGGFTYGPTREVDLNSALRDKVVDQCMTQKGYTRVTLPRCSTRDLARITRPVEQAAQYGEDACLARSNAGTWVVVTPTDAS